MSKQAMKLSPIGLPYPALIAILLIAICLSIHSLPSIASEPGVKAGKSMKEQRQEAANRRRRIIMNNDGAEPVMHMRSPSAQEFLDKRTTPLVGTQVDSIFYCPRCSGFGMFTYFTKVGEIFTTREGRYEHNQMEALLREGIDPLQVIVEFCKQNKLEIFCSFRMNDNHDGTSADYAPLIFRANKFKNAHPELLLGTREKRPKFGAWAAVDYGRPEIRELAFRFAEEVCKNYDVDGIELDFFRHIVYFKSTSRGEVATDAERAAMTDLLTRIRTMADEVGKERGRPILIAVRVPDSVEYCHAVGLDLDRWLSEDLVDLYMPAGTFQLNDWDYSVSLARKHGVKVYPSLDDARGKDADGKSLRMTNLAYRGRAANVWAAGADGLYLYNFAGYVGAPALLNELGSPEMLARLDKDYVPAARGVVRTSGGNLPNESYRHCETLNPDHPKKVAPGNSVSARLMVGEPLDHQSPDNFLLRLRVRGVVDAAAIKVSVNGQLVQTKAAGDDWFDCAVAKNKLKKGSNEIELALTAAAKSPISWLDAVLQVRHNQ